MNLNKELFLKTVKQYSYFKNEVNWVEFEKSLTSIPETLESINILLKKIDKHSFLVAHSKSVDDSKIDSKTTGVGSEEYNQYIGILKLHGFFSPDNRSEDYKKNYREIVSSLNILKHKKYLILDLADNSGGNMWPWLAALAPIYSTDAVGYFEYRYKDEKDAWLIKDDGVYSGNTSYFSEINKDQYNFSKIAVLISADTKSSGEAIAMSLKDQNNVKLFGQKTAGFTTGNEDYKIGDIILWLSVGMMQDRNQESYPKGIFPDIETIDPLEKAVEWLNI